MTFPLTRLLLMCALSHSIFAAEKSPAAAGGSIDWIVFPNPQLEVRGLPWFDENSPELWRLPKSQQPAIPKGGWTRAVAPDGARIRFTCATAQLAIRVQVVQPHTKVAHFDAYINDEYAGSGGSRSPETKDLVLFSGRDRSPKNITIYLPNTSEVRVLAVGIDAGAALKPAPAFAIEAPLIAYGSSVLQGTGSAHASKTYPAVVARKLNLDFVNLGFGGAGKAEPHVVALANRPAASCFLFDLGKSYGAQTQEPFARMLADIRKTHPTVPIICVTPIFSTKEDTEKGYREKSENLRTLMRDAAVERRNAGDWNIHVVEGLELFGPADKHLFNDPLHPNDAGNELMGERLVELIRSLVFNRK